MLTRRSLLQSTGLLAVGTVLRGFAKTANQISLRLVPNPPATAVPKNFIGLGYEMSSAAQLGLLSAHNAKYVQLVRNLGSNGVLRLGGIVADFTRYVPDGPVRAEPKATTVTRASLEQLRGFLDLTGWSALWSLNFGAGTLEEAIAEARDVQSILGPRLDAVELGNEVENYGRGTHPLRQPPWDFPNFLQRYREWRRALLAAIPSLKFAAPDTAASIEWVQQMAKQAPREVQLLTTHFYLGDQRKATLPQLLEPDPQLVARLETLRQISRSSGLPWRMCETNSFFGGGHPGLSDTFAGALWTLDYLLLLARHGCAGVNLETGVNQLGFVSSYSPIRADEQGRVETGAPYYGMLAFAASGAVGAEVLDLEIQGSRLGLTAYAIRRQGRLHSVVLLNRSQAEEASVSFAGLGLDSAEVLRLTAPSLTSKDDVRFGGSAVDEQGRWSPLTSERLHSGLVTVPVTSAVVFLAAA